MTPARRRSAARTRPTRPPRPPRTWRRLAAAFALLAATAGASAGPPAGEDEVIPHRQDRPPNRPYSPREAIARMEVPEGFSVELVAAEPDIVNPVAMAFDDRGRIWVTESLEYPRKPAGEGRDRVKVLEDTDRDGRADRVSVFAEGLNIPSGIEVGFGGVWVLNAPDLLFFREEDGRAASREVVLTGFGRTDTHELPNSLTWGPDGWLYGLNGVFNRSRVVSGGTEHRFTCALFRVHPRTHEFQVVCEGTSNPWGLVWDPEGSAIVSACHWAKDHVFHFVETAYYQRQAGAYPPHAWPIGSVSDHGHQKTAYCGLAWLDSAAYPERYRGRLYMGNVHGNCINVDVLERDGSTYVSRAAPDFLTANDAWFMPVAQAVGPDGCLYILDWYDRYHCYQDANRDPEGVDRDRGRLYRVRYGETPRAPRFDLARESGDELVARLDSPNVYFRQRAQRLLSERATPEVRERLRRAVDDPAASRRSRLHALWALIGTGSLAADHHLGLLRHPDPAVRAWAVRAAGDLESVTPGVREAVAGLAFDAAPAVGLQTAIAAGKLDGLDPLPVLVNVLASCGEDRLIPPVVWSNLHPLLEERAGDFADRVRTADLERAPALVRTLPRASARLLAGPRPGRHARVVAGLLALAARHDREAARRSIAGLAARVRELDEGSVAELAAALRPVLDRLLARDQPASLATPAKLLAARLGLAPVDVESVRAKLLDEEAPRTERLQALDALIVSGDERLLESVDAVLAQAAPDLASGVLAALGPVDDRRVADVVLGQYEELEPRVRPLAVDLLLERPRWARKLLDRVLSGELPEDTLHANHLRRILAGNDRHAIWDVQDHWGAVRSERDPERERVVDEQDRYLRAHPGDPRRGREVFGRFCSQCHVIWGEGNAVGPDLTSNGRASFRQLLSNVFDPNLVVGPGYETTTVMTTGGRVLSGLRVEETDARLVLLLQGGRREAFPRSRVKHAHTETISLMPEGIETLLGKQELADLFAFLALDGPPANPPPRAIPGAPAWVARAAEEAAEAVEADAAAPAGGG